MNLQLKQKNSNLLVYTLPPGFRIFFFALALFLIADMLIRKAVAPLPLFLFLISLGGGFYHEAWRFNRQTASMEHHFGLLFFSRRKSVAFSQIEQFTVTEIVKGSSRSTPQEKRSFFQTSQRGRTGIVKLSLCLKDGPKLAMDIRNLRARTILEQNGREISRFCSKPFQTE